MLLLHIISYLHVYPQLYFNELKLVLINIFCSLYTHVHAGTVSGTIDTGGLSTDLMVALGVGIVTLVIILVSCCTKKHRSGQLQGEHMM